MATRTIVFGVAACGAAAYSWVGAGTHPFSLGADLVTAVPIGVGAAAATRFWAKRRAGRAAGGGSERLGTGSLAPWWVVLVLAICWELAMYFLGFSGHRSQYPTLSSLYDSATRWRAAKTGLFFVWLALGWGLFGPRAGLLRQSRGQSP